MRGVYFLFLSILVGGCASQYMTAGKVYIQQEEYDKAVEQFNLQLKQNPTDVDAWWWLGVAYTYQKKYEDACQSIDKVAEIAPNKLELKKQKSFLWSLYYSAGVDAYQKSDWLLAEKRFKRAIDFEPDSVLSYMNLATIYSQLENEDSSLVYHEKVLVLDSTKIDAYRNLGAYYIKKKEYDKAVSYFKGGIAVAPKDADLLYRLGIAYYLKNDYPNAETNFRYAIECDSTLEDAYFNLGATLVKREKYDEAIEVLKRTVALNPKDVEALIHLGGTYILTKKYELAVETYTKVIELDPSNRDAYEGRANAYWQLGKKKEAEVDLKKAQELE